MLFLRLILYLTCGIIFLSGCTASAQIETVPIPGVQIIRPEFQPLIATLQSKTQVPIVLPTEIPTDALVPLETGPQPYLNVPLTAEGHFQQVVPHITQATETHYEISLDATTDCQGSDRCSFGFLSGQQVFQDTPTVAALYAFELDPEFQPLARSPEAMGEVALDFGLTGYFVPFVCGANCDTAKLFWEQNGVRYGVGIRYGSQNMLINLANSILHNERTTP